MTRAHYFPKILLVVLSLLLFGTGCTKRTTRVTCSVEGTVSYQGKPISGGFIVFSNLEAGILQSARLEADGRYRLGEIPVGEYKVYFGDPPPPGPEETAPTADRSPLPIPQQYKSPETSQLTATLNSGTNKLNFDLK
jgi:hypothetical protein